MKVSGAGSIKFYSSEDELPHAPETMPEWQESVVLYFWDTEQEAFGFFRIGREPNRKPHGLAVLWSNVWVDGKYYKNYGSFPLRHEDLTETGFIAGSICEYRFNGQHCWSLKDSDVTAEIVMQDFHQGFNFFPTSAGTLTNDVSKEHIEASGSVSGTINFQGKTLVLRNAVGYRDHSWGQRKWDIMRSHRWTPAIFGADLTFQALSWSGADGSLVTFGFVIRNNTIESPKKVDILTYSETDSVTNRGGLVRMEMHDGEVLECMFTPVAPGGVSFHHGYPCVDTLCRVTMSGREGVGCFEAGYNALGGIHKPLQSGLVFGKIDNGIFDYSVPSGANK